MPDKTIYERFDAKWKWLKEGRWPKCHGCGERATLLTKAGKNVCDEHSST